MPLEPQVEATTNALLDCVARVLEVAGLTGLPNRAVLIYGVIDPDGDEKVDYVVTADMRITDVIGYGHLLRESATRELLADD